MLKFVPSEDIAVAVAMNVFDTEFVNQVTEETLRAILPGYGNPESGAAERAAASATPPFELPAGSYSGEIRTFERTIPLLLDKSVNGEIHAHLGDPAFPPKSVFILPPIVPPLARPVPGSFPGAHRRPSRREASPSRLPRPQIRRRRPRRDGFRDDDGGLAFGPGSDPRMRFHLPYRVSLKRTGSG
jgi:hypothetical protein